MSDPSTPPPGRTVAAKLQVKPGDTVAIRATSEERALLGALPSGALDGRSGEAAVVVSFVHDRDEPLERFAADLPAFGAAVRVRPLAAGEAPLG